MHGDGSGLRFNEGFDIKLLVVGKGLLIVFNLTHRYSKSGLALVYGVDIYRHEPSSLFHYIVFKLVYCFREYALMALGGHYANRILSVSCTRSCAWVWGEVCAVNEVLPIACCWPLRAVVLVW